LVGRVGIEPTTN